jgi:hypothetical protein
MVAVTVVVVSSCVRVVVVVGFVFVPAGEFGFEKGVKPLRERPLSLDDCARVSIEMFG